jgi:ubiquitin C-terminal hydrolase
MPPSPEQQYLNVTKQHEPLKMEERCRDPEVPSGLKNIGNTCYFNSIMQGLFFLPNIQKKIINFKFDENIVLNEKIEKAEKTKILMSRELIKNL